MTLEQVVIWNLPEERKEEVIEMFKGKYERYRNDNYSKGEAERMAWVVVYDHYYSEIQKRVNQD